MVHYLMCRNRKHMCCMCSCSCLLTPSMFMPHHDPLLQSWSGGGVLLPHFGVRNINQTARVEILWCSTDFPSTFDNFSLNPHIVNVNCLGALRYPGSSKRGSCLLNKMLLFLQVHIDIKDINFTNHTGSDLKQA